MREKTAAYPAGFSLVELMMAMVVTMIVTGAIYGLLSGGQSAFRVQPERTERQQNIRNAMDAIMRDIATAGVGLPDLAQVFTRNLNGAGPVGPNGPTDILEMATNPDNFPNMPTCAGSTSTSLTLADVTATFATLPRGVLLVTSEVPGPTWAGVLVTSVAPAPPPGGSANCSTAVNGQRPSLTLATTCTASGFGNAVLANCPVSTVVPGDIIRYDIRIDPADRVPSLWRSHPLGGPADVMIARGIEDLKVEYIQANMPGTCDAANPCASAPRVLFTTPAPTPTNTDYNTIITQVQVTLSARSNVQGLQGQTQIVKGVGQAWLRGSLTSTGTPRAALYAANKQQPLPVGARPVWH